MTGLSTSAFTIADMCHCVIAGRVFIKKKEGVGLGKLLEKMSFHFFKLVRNVILLVMKLEGIQHFSVLNSRNVA